MTLVAGVDSSTQSCKVVVRDAESGALVREGRASHPDGTEVDPAAWSAARSCRVSPARSVDVASSATPVTARASATSGSARNAAARSLSSR